MNAYLKVQMLIIFVLLTSHTFISTLTYDQFGRCIYLKRDYLQQVRGVVQRAIILRFKLV